MAVMTYYINTPAEESNSRISFSRTEKDNFSLFLNEKNKENPGFIFTKYFLTTEYPCLRNLFLLTAFLATFFDTEKENLVSILLDCGTE